MIRSWKTLALSLALVVASGPAWAQATRTISNRAARGDYAPVTVEVHPGHGVTLNFRPVGAIVRRAWLDDPSQVTLDFDDTRCAAVAAPGECAATVIHLRQIQPLAFPGLPATATTTLTVVTDRDLYTFQLAFPNSGAPAYSILAIQPDAPSPYASAILTTQIASPDGVRWVEQGLLEAQRRNLVATEDPLWERLQALLDQLKQGTPLTEAAQAAGVSEALVVRLAELGRSDAGITQGR
ncbi:hypothetical protein IQ254_06995 [Nodosilinea sp. LEGE 07088]|uniref:hypothetical protein n=1 Tax=Nodosilinea sp. LEGE 07088 TaxID=2777968 RepID=UPI0018825C5E|nr:hypothetical protein [Nodosilinea sp. LEGE 07088]MBE9136949.1 hypothetical protein [Nodosilinea sp. LEGE 07088]